MLKLFQYNRIYLLDNNYHFIGIYLDINRRNDQTKVFGLDNIEFIFANIDYKTGSI